MDREISDRTDLRSNRHLGTARQAQGGLRRWDIEAMEKHRKGARPGKADARHGQHKRAQESDTSHSLEAEENLLGSVLIDGDTINFIMLRKQIFVHRCEHRHIVLVS